MMSLQFLPSLRAWRVNNNFTFNISRHQQFKTAKLKSTFQERNFKFIVKKKIRVVCLSSDWSTERGGTSAQSPGDFQDADV